MQRGADNRGQASVELLAAVPIALILALLLAQLAVAGYALWSAGAAARAGARAAHVGADATRAATAVLPGFLEPAEVGEAGQRVRVQVRARALVPGVAAIPIEASARLDPAAGAPR